MNNEIDYEEFIKNIGCTFYEKIDVDNRNICKRLRVYTLHNSKKAVTAD